MTRPSLTSVYLYGLLVVLFGVVVHAPLSVFFGSLLPEFAEPIKAWKEILLAILGIFALILLTKRRLWGRFTTEWPVRLALGYILLHLVLGILFGGELETVIAGLMIDLRFVAFFLLVYTAALFRPDTVMKLVKVAAAGAALVLGFGLLQMTVLPDDVLKYLGYGQDTIRPFTTIDRNPDFVRINSTLRGPNPLGAMCVIYGSLALAYLLRRWRATSSHKQIFAAVALGLATVVLFASFSRSAYLAFILAVLVIAIAVKVKVPTKRVLVAAGGVIAAGVVVMSFVQSTDWYSNVILHEDPESTVVSKSNQGHIDSLADGVNRAVRQPLGAGVGSTGSASLYDVDTQNDVIIENWYLFVAHESGWLGLALFLALNVLALFSLWYQRNSWLAFGLFGAGVGLILIGLLLPVWADETVAFTWWGLVGGILGNGYAKRTRQ